VVKFQAHFVSTCRRNRSIEGGARLARHLGQRRESGARPHIRGMTMALRYCAHQSPPQNAARGLTSMSNTGFEPATVDARQVLAPPRRPFRQQARRLAVKH
jgi:hypothetical protein